MEACLTQELLPYRRALLGHVLLRQLLHAPDGLDEEEVLRGILLLQEGTEVVPPHRVLEQVPAAEAPLADATLSHL